MKMWHWILLCFLFLSLIIIELLFLYNTDQAYHWWNLIPAFFSIFGFVGCLAIIFFSKMLGKLFIQKKEDYYDVD